VYIKIDYCGIYKLPCETHYDHFKYVVMTFDLTNAHFIFQC
jgi:hypothetical protein